MTKVKVVEIENDQIPTQEEVVKEEVEPPTKQLAIEEPKSDEPSSPLSTKAEPEEPNTKSKKDDKITCSTCGKTMLTKTFKYSHQKLCPPKAPPPSPSPPVSKPKESKPKEAKTKAANNMHQYAAEKEQEQPEWDGKVFFDNRQATAQAYHAAREQRVQVRQQRVKSLISQAI